MHGMNGTHKRQKSSCVATLAALAGEMAGVCDTWLSRVRTYLGVLKFGYIVTNPVEP